LEKKAEKELAFRPRLLLKMFNETIAADQVQFVDADS